MESGGRWSVRLMIGAGVMLDGVVMHISFIRSLPSLWGALLFIVEARQQGQLLMLWSLIVGFVIYYCVHTNV